MIIKGIISMVLDDDENDLTIKADKYEKERYPFFG